MHTARENDSPSGDTSDRVFGFAGFLLFATSTACRRNAGYYETGPTGVDFLYPFTIPLFFLLPLVIDDLPFLPIAAWLIWYLILRWLERYAGGARPERLRLEPESDSRSVAGDHSCDNSN